MPFLSAASYLKFHSPSLSLFQYAPAAECMPLLPALGLLDAVPGWASAAVPLVSASSFLTSVSLEAASVAVSVAVDAEEEEVSGCECCMMVLLTANLYLGGESGVEVSEIRDLRMVF